MALEYAPIFLDWPTVTRELNAQEKGRLIDAIIAYQAGGDWQEQIKGNERYVFPGYQVRIDRWNEISEKRAKAPKGEQTETNQDKREQTETNDNKTPKVKSKKNKSLEEEEKDAGAWVSDSEIKEALDRDQQIESAALSAGLNVSEINMVKAREYARVYGMDKLLDAIAKTAHGAERITWAYVEGVLKGNGTRPETQYRGNNSGVPINGEPSGKYHHLFT